MFPTWSLPEAVGDRSICSLTSRTELYLSLEFTLLYGDYMPAQPLYSGNYRAKSIPVPALPTLLTDGYGLVKTASRAYRLFGHLPAEEQE
jgi:hypothetical protein